MKVTFGLIVALILALIFGVTLLNKNNNGGLVKPGFSQTPAPTNAPPVAPKSFQFDASTDLNAELEKINPELLDSDFE